MYEKWHISSIYCLLVLLQVDPKFMKNMRFAKKHNKKGQKTANAAAKKIAAAAAP